MPRPQGYRREAKTKRRLSSAGRSDCLCRATISAAPLGLWRQSLSGLSLSRRSPENSSTPEEVAEHHPDADDEYVWAGWRAAVWKNSSIPGRLARNREDTSGFEGGGSRRSEGCNVSRGFREIGNGDGPIAMPLDHRLDIDGLRD